MKTFLSVKGQSIFLRLYNFFQICAPHCCLLASANQSKQLKCPLESGRFFTRWQLQFERKINQIWRNRAGVKTTIR